MPASPEMEELEAKLDAKYKIYKMREALDSIDDFDAVFIDTPPSIGFFTLSALIAADRCLIPFDCDQFSRRALYRLLRDVEEGREDHNEKLQVGGIVVNQFQERATLPGRLVEELREEGHPVLEPYVSQSVKVRESHQAARPLVFLARTHKVTRQFVALHETLVGLEGKS